MISNTRVLVERFLTYSDQTIWVRVTSTSVVDLCLRPLSWLGWMKLLEIVWNWSRSPIIFLKSFPIVLRGTMGQYNLGESNMALLGLEITTMVEVLKWDGQYPKFIQVLAISMNLQIQSSLLIIDFKWLQINLSGPGADEFLYFLICINEFFLGKRIPHSSSLVWNFV